MKRILMMIGLMALTATMAFAQKGVEDGSRFGHGQDSINALNNISIYSEYIKTSNFEEAYEPWKKVFEEAPLAQVATYTKGVALLKNLIAKTKEYEPRKAYADELMAVYDQEIKYLPQLDLLVKTQLKDYRVLGQKAHDYLTYYPKMDAREARKMLLESLEKGGTDSEYYLLGDLMKTSSSIFKADETFREDFIQDYLVASDLIAEIYSKAIDAEYPSEEKEAEMVKAVTATKDNVDAYFINSGAADCDQLQAIYAPKVEENKGDIDYLTKVIAVMSLLNCTESDVYYTASEYAHRLNPTAGSAAGCAYSYFKRGDVGKSLEFFNQAIELEGDNAKKAEYNYKAAVIANSDKRLSLAKSYCQRAIGLNGRKGAYYILLANIYAAAPNWSDKPELNPCKYYVVIDKLARAKSVDESVASEANRLIGIYSQHTPDPAQLFFLGYKQGDTVHVGGLIDENTTIR
ncbi:MAG: hypothetical protein J5698_02305 [Bacteroidaceae bacterium]|nr:hypothetical protein [Bacteroidaceae bacterium]MBO4589787.1 hypothetical protein [Bacteroidaceae bacterium]MBR5964160.1 hypothetical protein [Bacteroidaceae bacterium]